MSSFLIELWSTEQSDTVPIKDISLCSRFLKPFNILPKQKLYQIMLLFSLTFT